MAVDQLSTTTLGEALDAHKNNFVVTSTANMSVGDYIVCRAEAMKIREVINSTRVTVVRGVGGTKARPHKISQRFFIGSPHQFQSIRDSLTSLVGDTGTYPEFMLPGQRANDAAGNEYVLLGPLAIPMPIGTTVVIDQNGNYGCTIAYATKQGSVAVLVESATSDQYVWGQVYGYNAICQEASATSGVSSAYIPVAQTSVSSPTVGMRASASAAGEYVIHGMFIVGAASTATTAATSAIGTTVPVWLNYPYLKLYFEGTCWAP
jgi:hypothetical protein